MNTFFASFIVDCYSWNMYEYVVITLAMAGRVPNIWRSGISFRRFSWLPMAPPPRHGREKSQIHCPKAWHHGGTHRFMVDF